MLVTDENHYAAKPKEGEITVDKGNGSNVDLTNETTPPDIYSVTTVVTTNSITVTVGAKDNESGIYGYEYSIDNGVTYTEIQRNNTYTFEGLTNEKEYNVKVRVYNGIYGKDTYSDEKGRNEKEFDNNPISLKTIETPKFTILPEGWSLEKEVTIKYYGAQIQEYSIDGGNTFIEYTGSFTVTNNIDITAKASDGQNEVTYTANIRTIDNEKPTVEVKDINTSYETKDEITLTLNDNSSGVTHYCVISENTSDNCNWISGSGIVKYTINTNGTYYAYSKDLVGNISEAKEFVIDKIDTESPSASLELESKTTNSITVKAVCTDNVGITKYEYSKDNGVTYETGINETYTFSNLTTGTYNMKVRCSDEAGNSKEANVTDKTTDLPIPTYAVSNSGSWSTSKTVTINYPEGYTNIYKVINGSATKEDGTILEIEKEYQASNVQEKVIFTSNGNIIAGISDGINIKWSSDTQAVSDIETVKPTDMTLSANSDTAYAKTKSVTVTLQDTGGSGLAAGSIKYGWSTSTSTAPSSYTTVSTSATSGTNTTTFVASGSGLSGSYYLWIVPVTYKDNAGNSNTTTVKSTGTFNFDNTVPTLTLGTVSTTSDVITVPYTASDSHSGINTTTCVYGTSTSYGSNGTISGSNCVMSGLNSGTTYYYKVTTTDKAGNSTYKTGSSTTIYNTGDAVTLGGYKWHVIGEYKDDQNRTLVTLLMDAGQVSDMIHCTNDTDASTDCGVDSTGTYYVYSWDKSLIRTYLNSTFLSKLESKISNEIVSTSICADPSTGDGSTTYGGYLMSELNALGVTSSCTSTVSDKVRLITYSEYYNMSPYYTDTDSSYPNVENITKIAKSSDYASWLYCESTICGSNREGHWWTMDSSSKKYAKYVIYARIVGGWGDLNISNGNYFKSVRPVITIVK